MRLIDVKFDLAVSMSVPDTTRNSSTALVSWLQAKIRSMHVPENTKVFGTSATASIHSPGLKPGTNHHARVKVSDIPHNQLRDGQI